MTAQGVGQPSRESVSVGALSLFLPVENIPGECEGAAPPRFGRRGKARRKLCSIAIQVGRGVSGDRRLPSRISGRRGRGL